MVQLEDVISEAEKKPLHCHIAFSPGQETSELHILLDHCKGTLSLDRAVDAQQTAFLRADALFHLFPLAQEVLVDVQRLGSLLQGLLTVSLTDTFLFAGTALAVLTAVNGHFRLEAGLRLLGFYL